MDESADASEDWTETSEYWTETVADNPRYGNDIERWPSQEPHLSAIETGTKKQGVEERMQENVSNSLY